MCHTQQVIFEVLDELLIANLGFLKRCARAKQACLQMFICSKARAEQTFFKLSNHQRGASAEVSINEEHTKWMDERLEDKLIKKFSVEAAYEKVFISILRNNHCCVERSHQIGAMTGLRRYRRQWKDPVGVEIKLLFAGPGLKRFGQTKPELVSTRELTKHKLDFGKVYPRFSAE